MENNAWLLKDNSGDFFSVCEVEMVEYIPTVTIFSIPNTPYYCRHVMEWRNNLIPVVDFASLFTEAIKSVVLHVGVFAYQTDENKPLNYLAIAIKDAPSHITVSDTQYCDLPKRYSEEKLALALSCFSYQEFSVPILNINYLCSTELRDHAMNLN